MNTKKMCFIIIFTYLTWTFKLTNVFIYNQYLILLSYSRVTLNTSNDFPCAKEYDEPVQYNIEQ